ncbi:sigma-70 family RNA polymerase sigma factor [Niabella aurantiaca]|uniref:sigma-70 family RNA polymerase sigma factor n=1 Tax=Niabella aurantiaca TaxID=379900 RepID=UPI0003718690|nr:sigma-70 family RNA polymerase sigma factor [Niabella aurantiaca]
MDYVSEIKRGNKLIFEEVYHKYHNRFYFYVLRNTASDDLAEEVVQMSFVKVWEKRSELSSSFPIEVQIARIARSVLIDILRRKAIERSALDAIKQNADAVIARDPAADKQLVEKVQEAIESLPPQCKKIFILSREGGLTHLQIADHLSVSPKTVENHISKALKVVRKAAALCFIMGL